MTLAVLASRAIAGWQAPAVRVETHLGSGLPAFAIVGLPDVEVRESRERVRAAIQNSGFDFPPGRITVNLSPADLPKASARFDLPIALGILLASGQVAASAAQTAALPDSVWAAELSLSGALVPPAAPLALALAVAREQPGATLVLPPAAPPWPHGCRASGCWPRIRWAKPRRTWPDMPNWRRPSAAPGPRPNPVRACPTYGANRLPGALWKWRPPAATAS